MGTVRLILSLFVVGSHVGGMGNTPAGAVAIAGFFAISGFLMARTITENYQGARTPRFYLNRAIRLGPPLLAVMCLTALVLWLRDSRPFLIKQPVGVYMPVQLPDSATSWITWNWRGFPLYMYPSFRLLPQAWSLITESAFYLVAPLLALLFGTRLAAIGWLAPAASLYLAWSAYGDNWLRSPFASLWIFWLGMQAYFFARARRWTDRQAAVARRVGVVLVLPVVAMGYGATNIPDGVIFFVVPLLIAGWLVLGQWHHRRSAGADRLFGNLSYGVFLGHYLSTILMYWIAEGFFRVTGVFGIFGIPDIRETRLRISSFVFALLFGAAIYYGCERPLERLRARVRGPRAASAGTPAGLTQAAM